MTVFDLSGFCGHRLKNGGLYAGRATKPPQHARQSKHQLALHGRFSVIVGDHRGFEGLVILCILERRNDGLGREAVAYRIAARTFRKTTVRVARPPSAVFARTWRPAWLEKGPLCRGNSGICLALPFSGGIRLSYQYDKATRKGS